MTKTVEFYFDVGSPAAYLAWTQLPKICADAGAKLVYKPMLLGGVFKDTGNAPPINIPAKGKWMLADLARYADYYGVPLNFNPYFPINTLFLMRAAAALVTAEPERFEALIAAAFNAIWVDEKDMGDSQVTAQVLAEAGFDPQTLVELTQQSATKEALIKLTAEAVQRGVFGAPTCFVGEEMFFGQDRMDFIQRALQ